MNRGGSADAGPDGFGPIDAVVTWVDGHDPQFRRRRERAARSLARLDPDLAQRSELRFAPVRYVQHDEIRYCIRSIVNHAPWIRRIWLVTDDQFPSAFDQAALDRRIVVVDHRELFREFPDALPTFNSGAIEAMLWRIAGLAPRFVYFNDDFFLSKPVSPQDFFLGEKPVLRGKWTDFDPASPAWLQRRMRSARLFETADERFFKEVHAPYGLSVRVLEAVFSRHPGLLEGMTRHRFRTANDHNVLSLHNHHCLAEGVGVMDTTNRWLVYGSYPQDADEESIRRSLERIPSGRFMSTCFNVLSEYLANVPDLLDYLDAGAGPRLAFET